MSTHETDHYGYFGHFNDDGACLCECEECGDIVCRCDGCDAVACGMHEAPAANPGSPTAEEQQ